MITDTSGVDNNIDRFLNYIFMFIKVLNITRQQISVKSKNKRKKNMLRSSQPNNKMWRYICYKQFTYWINSWNSIGKGMIV